MSSRVLRAALRPYLRRDFLRRFLRDYFLAAAAMLAAGTALVVAWFTGWSAVRPIAILAGALVTALPVSALVAARRRTGAFAALDEAARAKHLFASAAEILATEQADRALPEAEQAVIARAAAAVRSRRPFEDIPFRLPRTAVFVPLVLLAYSVIAFAFLSRGTGAWSGAGSPTATGSAPIAAPETERDAGAELARELARLDELLETRPGEKEFLFRSDEIPGLEGDPGRGLGASDLAATSEEPTAAPDGPPERRGSLEAPAGEADGTPVIVPGKGPGADPGEAAGEERPGGSNDAAARQLGSDTPPGGSSGSDESGKSGGPVDRPADSADGSGKSTGRSGDELSEREEGGRAGGGNPGTAGTESERTEPGRDLSDVIKELLELPRGEIGPGYMELLARELAGPDGGGTSPGASANTFERQLQSVVARGEVPAELRAYVTDYFVAIAGDETRREP